MVDARKIIDRVMDHTGWKQYEVAEKVFGISDKNLCNRIRRNTINLGKLIEWAIHESVDLAWLLTEKPHQAHGQPPESTILLSSISDYEQTHERAPICPFLKMYDILKTDLKLLNARMEILEQMNKKGRRPRIDYKSLQVLEQMKKERPPAGTEERRQSYRQLKSLLCSDSG